MRSTRAFGRLKSPASNVLCTRGSRHVTAAITSASSFHGHESLALSMSSGNGIVGMNNRGLGHEGLVFVASKDYNGYFFALSTKATTFTVALVDYTSNTTLGSQVIHFPGAQNWTMVNFTMIAAASTSCTSLDASTAEVSCGEMGPQSHICVQCGGEFVIGLSEPGTAFVDYVYLQQTDGVVPGTVGECIRHPVAHSEPHTITSAYVWPSNAACESTVKWHRPCICGCHLQRDGDQYRPLGRIICCRELLLLEELAWQAVVTPLHRCCVCP